MDDRPVGTDSTQFSLFKDSVAQFIVSQLDGDSDAVRGDATSDLDEFVSYLASEAWTTLTADIQTIKYAGVDTSSVDVDNLPLNPPISFIHTLRAYSLISSSDDDNEDFDSSVKILRNIVSSYIAEATAPPPPWSSTRTSACEICDRDVPLTYHHLIPRGAHAKALKRKWHPEWMLNSVAWLCRPCHSTVHRVASTEVLARDYYTIDRLLAREDIQKWKGYASKQRWGRRR